MAAIWSSLFSNYTREMSYSAEMANISSSFDASSTGYELFVGGFSDSIP